MKKIIREDVGSNFVGKTVNFYGDEANKINGASGKITRLYPTKKDGVDQILINVEVSELGKNTTQNLQLAFTCVGLLKSLANLPKKGFPVMGLKKGILFNDNLYDAMEKQFCSKSRGGTIVPKADFAKVDTNANQAMAESKRVVRLTESDLVRLTKKIINEGFVQEFTKDQAMGAFDEQGTNQGTVTYDDSLKTMVFRIGSRKFFIKELK